MADVLLSPSQIGPRSSVFDVKTKQQLQMMSPSASTSVSSSSSSPSSSSTDIDEELTNDTTHLGTPTRRNTDTKRERPRSSFLDSPTQTFPAELTDFLSIQSPVTKPSRNTYNSAAVLSPSRRPFRNLSNLMNSFKKGLTRHTTVGVHHSPPLHYHEISLDDDDFDEDIENEIEDEHQQKHQNEHQIEHFALPKAPKLKHGLTIPTLAKKSPPQPSIRRIQSMYHTEKERAPISMQTNSVLDKSTLLPFKVDNDLLPRIGIEDMNRILDGHHSAEFDEFIIVDSRFPYEYEGGHIKSAMNISSQQDLEDAFINNCTHNGGDNNGNRRKLIIFHCEFSIFRGPTMASHLRKCDRIANAEHYPRLTYPDIVVLEGGYKKFFDNFKSYCEPQSYIEMKDINHRKTCEVEMNKARQASKLTRAKSYQFSHTDSKSFSQLQSLNQNLQRTPQLQQQAPQTQNSFRVRPKSFQHMRSSSYTTVTSHSENLKVLKRQRSISKMKSFTDSLPQAEPSLDTDEVTRGQRSSSIAYSLSFFNSTSSPASSPTIANGFDCDDFMSPFQPPPAIRSINSINRRSGGSSFLTNASSASSINSYLSISDGLAFSSTESLSDSYTSPMMEYQDYFDNSNSITSLSSTSSKHSNSNSYMNSYIINNNVNSTNGSTSNSFNSLLNPMAKKPQSALPQLPRANNIQPQLQFKFPMQGLGLKAKNSRNRLNTSTPIIHLANTNLNSNSHSLPTTSPIISSPLSTITPASDSAKISNMSSIIDPINDTPVDFSVPTSQRHTKHSRRRSGLGLSSGCINFITLDIDEIDEEDDIENEADGTLTEIKFTKSPFI